jgi:hypothetical protein
VRISGRLETDCQESSGEQDLREDSVSKGRGVAETVCGARAWSSIPKWVSDEHTARTSISSDAGYVSSAQKLPRGMECDQVNVNRPETRSLENRLSRCETYSRSHRPRGT